jgi:hypothetical protein
MPRRFQFSLPSAFLAFVFAGAARAVFPLALRWLDRSRSLTGPALLTLAASFAGAAVGALFGKAGWLALAGAVAAVLLMAAVVFFVGVC